MNWLTPEFGRVSTAAKGARRPKSPFSGKLDLFYEADLSFARSNRSDLHTLREVSLRETHAVLRRELGSLQQAGYAAALIEQTTESDTPLPDIFDLFCGFVNHVAASEAKPRNVFAFELRLLRALGLEPDAEEKFPEATRRLMSELTESPWEDLVKLRATTAQARGIQQFLHGFLIYQFGKLAAGRHGALGA